MINSKAAENSRNEQQASRNEQIRLANEQKWVETVTKSKQILIDQKKINVRK